MQKLPTDDCDVTHNTTSSHYWITHPSAIFILFWASGRSSKALVLQREWTAGCYQRAKCVNVEKWSLPSYIQDKKNYTKYVILSYLLNIFHVSTMLTFQESSCELHIQHALEYILPKYFFWPPGYAGGVDAKESAVMRIQQWYQLPLEQNKSANRNAWLRIMEAWDQVNIQFQTYLIKRVLADCPEVLGLQSAICSPLCVRLKQPQSSVCGVFPSIHPRRHTPPCFRL